MHPVRFDRFGVFGAAIVVENQRTSGEIIAVTGDRVGEIGHAGMRRRDISAMADQVVTLSCGTIPSIQTGKRADNPLIASHLSKHIRPHEARGRFAAHPLRCIRETPRCVKAVGGVEQPLAARRVAAHHPQLVPPRVGRVLYRVRHGGVLSIGDEDQQRRTQKHAR